MKLDQQLYFTRSGRPPEDGRAFDQRTLEAVNRTAYDVGSYRQFIIALDKAGDGETITVSGVVTVPETIQIKKQIKIQCIGSGAFIPGAEGLTLFEIADVGNVYFLDVRVLANESITTYIFIKHTQEAVEGQSLKNITIRRCYAEATVFSQFIATGAVPKSMERTAGNNYAFKYLGNRSILDGNIHVGIAPKDMDAVNLNHFMVGNFYMTTVTNNESNYGFIDLTNGGGTGNIVNSNLISGYLKWEVLGVPKRSSIRVDTSCWVNIFTSNILNYEVLDGLGNPPANTVVGNNMEFLP